MPGFGSGESKFGDTDEAYKRMFAPEFRNRLDAKVDFAPLDPTRYPAVPLAYAALKDDLEARGLEALKVFATEAVIANVAHRALAARRMVVSASEIRPTL
jgi:ATP-dependent Clp protease ATP-binding subunit ClpA